MKLKEKAMIANLTITQWTGRKQDREANEQTAQAAGADSGEISTNKYLVPRASFKKIAKLSGDARREFHLYTLPWKDEGERILTSTGYFELSKVMRKYSSQLNDAADDFAKDYPTLIKQQEKALGTLWKEEEIPAAATIREKFSFKFTVEPLADASDFRVNLSDAETEIIKQQIEQVSNERFNRAMHDIWERMHDVVAKMAERLKAYKVHEQPIGGSNGRKRYVEGNFEGTLVTNIQDLLTIIPALNLSDDPNVKQFAQQMKALCKWDAEELKSNTGTRINVAKAADDILQKMQQYV